MTQLTKEISNLTEMLKGIEEDLNIGDLNPTESYIFLMIISEIEKSGQCTMLKAVEVANKSRSTVYKTIRKLVTKNILEIANSDADKRSFFLVPKI
jgi:DNA-binding MarR family transcriptional regulator